MENFVTILVIMAPTALIIPVLVRRKLKQLRATPELRAQPVQDTADQNSAGESVASPSGE